MMTGEYKIWRMSNGVELRVDAEVEPPAEGTSWQLVVSREDARVGDEVTIYPVTMGRAISAEESRAQQQANRKAADRARREDLAQFIEGRLANHDSAQLADAVLEYLDEEYDWYG